MTPNSPHSGAQDTSSPRSAERALDLDVLDGLAQRPLAEHAAVYDQLHAQLQGALNDIDNR